MLSSWTGRAPKPSRGWTAFTAYGLETRARVRAANPGVHAAQIEKVRYTSAFRSRQATLSTQT